MSETIEIHFCEACNESVPVLDIEQRRAVRHAGKLLCARCAKSVLAGAALASAATAAASPAAASAPARRASGGFVGWIALFAAIAAAAWLYQRGEEQRLAITRELESQRAALRTQAAELGDELGTERERVQALTIALAEHETRARGELQALVEGSAAQRQAVDDTLAGLAERARLLEERWSEFARSNEQLSAVQAKLAAHDSGYQSLSQSIEDLRGKLASAAQVAPGVQASSVPLSTQPPWIGLVQGLSSTNFSDRWSAVKALEETRDPEAAEYLHPLLKDSDVFVRVVTAQALGTLGSQASVEILIGALNDADAPVREAAYGSLRKITKRDLPFDPQQPDPAERQKRIKAWQDWWKKSKESAGSS